MALAMVLALFLVLSLSTSLTARAGVTASGDTPLYETFTLTIAGHTVGARFAAYPIVIFTYGRPDEPGVPVHRRAHLVHGFYDGDGAGGQEGAVWRVRFMPAVEGLWSWTCSFAGRHEAGSFTCLPRTNPRNHGHVRRRGRYLVHDDGTDHIFVGSHWPYAGNLRPSTSLSFDGGSAFTDEEWDRYCDILAARRHNGTYLVIAQAPLANDMASFDLAWMKRLDRALESARARGIYVIVGLFNTWGRDASDAMKINTLSAGQLLDPWNGDVHRSEKEFYIRYVVSRFAGYANVYWELGNEMEHAPNDGERFAELARRDYMPWIRKYDPYDLPVTLSEEVAYLSEVDIIGLHQMESIPISATIPHLFSELVGPRELWKLERYADPAHRAEYRRSFWRSFSMGGVGSIECSAGNPMAETNGLIDPAVMAVMEDHGRLRAFLDGITTPLVEMHPLGPGGLGGADRHHESRGKAGIEYAGYFWGRAPGSTVSLALGLPEGMYRARWFHPSTGVFTEWGAVTDRESLRSPPLAADDVAVQIRRAAQSVAPDPQDINARRGASPPRTPDARFDH